MLRGWNILSGKAESVVLLPGKPKFSLQDWDWKIAFPAESGKEYIERDRINLETNRLNYSV